jgi:hypothetical protein
LIQTPSDHGQLQRYIKLNATPTFDSQQHYKLVSHGRTLADRNGVGANLEAWVTNHEERSEVELE